MFNTSSNFTPPPGYNPNLTEDEYYAAVQLENTAKSETEKMRREKRETEKTAMLFSRERRTAADILNTDYPPISWVVPDVIPEGLTKIDGGPKVGKSFLSLHLATAVSSGGCFMGSKYVEKREVLYLALEDGERRIKNRLLKQAEKGNVGTGNDKFFIYTSPTWNGGITALQVYLKEYKTTGLVIIDTLFMFSPMADTNSYADTYRPIAAIQKISTETGVPIVMIHHTRKGTRGDTGEGWADEGMGSQGINGACDTIILLKKPDGKFEGTMRIKGRDIEEICYNVAFDRDICTWRITGQGDIGKTETPARAEILLVLKEAGQAGMKTGDIADTLGKNTNTILDSLKPLAAQGKIKKLSHGLWAINSEIQENSKLNITEFPNNRESGKFRNSDTPSQTELTEFDKTKNEPEIW